MKTLLTALRSLLALTVITGGLYPLAVWAVSQAGFRHHAEGSLIARHGQLVGSERLAQKTTSLRYFWPRASAADFATVASGASNKAWSSAALGQVVGERRAAFPAGATVPADLLTASGSGLDPDLSPEAVRLQCDRVARARSLDTAQRRVLDELVAEQIVGGQLSPARINVLALNLALDVRFPTP